MASTFTPDYGPDFGPETIFDLLRHQALARPGHAALIEGDRRIGYGDLLTRAEAMAGGLHTQGVRRGHRVLMLVPLGLDFFVTFLALMRLGACAVLVDPAARFSTLRAAIGGLKPEVLVGVPKAHLFRLIPELGAIPLALSLGGWAPFARRVQEGEGSDLPSPTGEEAALITFTSGSTGLPKTIVRSHAFLLAQHGAVQSALDPQPDDVEFSTLPVFILSNLGAGITSVIPPKGYARPHRMDAEAMIAAMNDSGVNRLLAAPAFLGAICEVATRAHVDVPIRRIFTGGGPVFPNLLSALERVIPEAKLLMVYGSSEAEPIAHLYAHELSVADREAIARGAGLPAGHPVPDVNLRIVAVSDNPDVMPEPVPPGEVGEIIVSGPHVVTSYLDPAHNAGTKLRDGDTIWHRTGDAGYLDPEGRLWLMGRVSARIAREAGTLWPFAIEAAAMSVEGVKRAAIVEVDGRVVLAYEGEVSLAPFEGVDEMHRLDRIPVDARHHSKVLYAELRKLIEQTR